MRLTWRVDVISLSFERENLKDFTAEELWSIMSIFAAPLVLMFRRCRSQTQEQVIVYDFSRPMFHRLLDLCIGRDDDSPSITGILLLKGSAIRASRGNDDRMGARCFGILPFTTPLLIFERALSRTLRSVSCPNGCLSGHTGRLRRRHLPGAEQHLLRRWQRSG